MVWVQKPWLKSGTPQKGQKGQKGQNQAGGKGWQSGGSSWQSGKASAGKASASPAPAALPAGFEVDPSARYSGTVTTFWKWKGYGFITLDQSGVVPGDKVFIFWKNIQTEDRFPSLMKDTKVEFGLQKRRGENGPTLRAKTVTLPGGAVVSLQDNMDAQQKSFVGGQFLRYTGKLKFFSPKGGFGYVAIDPGYALDAEITKTELRVETAEVNAGGKQPRLMKDINVEFGIWETKKGAYKAYNMTLPGGLPMTQEGLEHRTAVGGRTYRGTIVLWSWKQGWGFIQPDASSVMPPQIQAKIALMNKSTQEKGKTAEHDKALYFRKMDCQAGFKPEKGTSVSFQPYTDDKGAGAFEIH